MSDGPSAVGGGGPAAGGSASRLDPRLLDAIVLVGLLVLAAVLRLPDLDTRGPWDADNGEQMLAIREIVRGQLTLLGPPASQGGIHHGPVFYYLGALFALPSGGDDPTAVTLGIALGGILTVGLTWWLVRAAGGGRAAAAASAIIVATSAHMIDASVRLWNPAFVAPGAALALAASLEGRRRRDPRWWVIAAVGLVVAGQSHILAWVLVVPLVLLALGDLRRGGSRVARWLVAGIAVVVLSFAPLALHEITTGFSELRSVLAAGASDPTGTSGPSLAIRLAFVPVRILSVPLVRDVAAVFAVSALAAVLTAAAATLASRARSPIAGPSRVLWLALIVCILILAFASSWLVTLTPLYVEHQYLALTPSIFALLGLGAAAVWQRRAGRVVVVVAAVLIVGWNLVAVPLPSVNADGGWPAGRAAAERVLDATSGLPTTALGVPDFKKTTALDYPLMVLGVPPVAQDEATRAAVLCDELFEEVVGLDCGGPAEEARLTEVGLAQGSLLTRFEAAPGRWISVYEIAGR